MLSIHQKLFTPSAALSYFEIKLVNSKFKPLYYISDYLTFSPSLLCETSAVSICGSLPITTMTSADSLQLLAKGAPPVR